MITSSTTGSETSSKSSVKKALAIGALAGAVTLTGVMAFFTDRVTTSVEGTAGTVDLSLDANWNDVANFNPGDKADMFYTITNDGNKSVDVRERIVVKSSVPMNTADQAEFEVYAATDVEQDAAGAYIPKADAKPVTFDAERVVSDDNTSITYNIAEYTLNGSGLNAENEDGVTDTSKGSEYVLVFNKASLNDFQGATVTVDLVAEAKQHRNTNDDTWDVVSTDSIVAGDAAIDVVPEQ